LQRQGETAGPRPAPRPATLRRAPAGRRAALCLATVALAVVLVGGGRAAEPQAPADAIERGAYLVRAAGCIACHTDKQGGGPPLAGGRALRTPYGTFYTPNITPDPDTGIGRWSDDDFIRALREGVSPEGDHLYPAFPYASYARMTRADMLDLKAFLFAQAPVARASKPHDLAFPLSIRWVNWPWKVLFLSTAPLEPDPALSPEANRGRYLVEALAHCGECHTPRNLLGATDPEDYLSGTRDGPEGEVVPNITPDPETGIGAWSVKDIAFLFRTGFLPDGNDVQGSMREAIDDGLKYLTQADLEAIASYLKAIPAIRYQVRKPRAPKAGGSFDFN
jgi:mono/diheme cytochrome c family protein